MAKRGRKPSTEKKEKNYFGEEQEQAVLDFLATSDKNIRNKIYEEKLKEPFTKMIDSIIRRYKYHIPGELHEETFRDVLGHLVIKTEKYDPSKGTKAYSYYGTICRNYLIGRLQEISKLTKRNPSYDVLQDTFKDNIKYTEEHNKGKELAVEAIDNLVDRIKEMIDNSKSEKLKPNEIKIGKALINLFENWDYILTTDKSNKLNKNAILLYLRDETGLNTKGVRDNMAKFKKEFFLIKDFLIQ